MVQPLGKWTDEHSTSGIWKYYEEEGLIYEDMEDSWNTYVMEDGRLIPVEKVPFSSFDYKRSTPITIHENRSLATSYTPPKPVEIAVSFTKFMTQQERWVRDLLLYTNMEEGVTLVQILMEHDEAEGLLIVSDGSVRYHNMSFGWVLSNPKTRKILVTGSGPGYGKGCSLRAEAYGMLAAITYVHLVCKYLGRIDAVNLLNVADNKELIDRCRDHAKYENIYPNVSNRGENDVTEQVWQSSQMEPLKSTFEWEPSHQDRKLPMALLSHRARMNVLADKLAGAYNDTCGKFRPIAPVLPASPAQLTIRGITVSSNYRKNLRNAFTEPRYIRYLMIKFQWSEFVV